VCRHDRTGARRAVSAGLTEAEADAVTADYADAQLDGLKRGMLAVALLALLSLLFTRRLPGKPAAAEVETVVTDPDARLRSSPGP
jgi:hypothetical protein